MKEKTEKIEDFGEKIGGAKKDLAAGYLKVLKETSVDDLVRQPLSKVFPKPNFKKLVSSTSMTVDDAIALSYIYSTIKSKPRANNSYSSSKTERWAKETRNIMDLFEQNLDHIQKDNHADIPAMLDKIPDAKRQLEFAFYCKMMMAFDFPLNHTGNLEGWNIKKTHDNMFVFINDNRMLSSETDNIDEAIGIMANRLKLKTPKQTNFRVRQVVATKELFIAVVPSGKNPIRMELDVSFATASEAASYIMNNREVLEEKWRKMRDEPSERREFNAERIGQDWRGGKSVSPEFFNETFKFKGVEFGNWVNQAEREGLLNKTYDALMDMSTALSISPSSLSLNSELSLAFGSRGGGRFSAHYEPRKTVINLTKTKGAGSLAHEWFHALDYFCAKQIEEVEFPLSMAMILYKGKEFTDFKDGLDTRIQMRRLLDDIGGKTAVLKRSSLLDSYRSKAYWGTKVEVVARSFEKYMIGKLEDIGIKNDFLVNIASTQDWLNKGVDIKKYPYPNDEEAQELGKSYNLLFKEIALHPVFKIEKPIELKQIGEDSLHTTLKSNEMENEFLRKEPAAVTAVHAIAKNRYDTNQVENAYQVTLLTDDNGKELKEWLLGYGGDYRVATAEEIEKLDPVHYIVPNSDDFSPEYALAVNMVLTAVDVMVEAKYSVTVDTDTVSEIPSFLTGEYMTLEEANKAFEDVLDERKQGKFSEYDSVKIYDYEKGEAVIISNFNQEKIREAKNVSKEVKMEENQPAQVPHEIKGVKLSNEQIEKLQQGEQVLVLGLTAPTGRVYNALLTWDTKKEGFKYEFPNRLLLVPHEVQGVKLNSEQIKKLQQGEQVLVTGLKSDRTGGFYNAFLTWNIEKGGFKYDFSPNERIKVEFVIPDTIKGITLTQENIQALKDGKEVFLSGMTASNGVKFDAPIYVDKKTGHIKCNEEQARKTPLPKPIKRVEIKRESSVKTKPKLKI